ncbi:MAG: TetR/AcrR family transcriptional regulator [Nitrospirae bacterium]|nr:TetR/AcrR family transcriptional regulator [Nitrospirota bacterium]
METSELAGAEGQPRQRRTHAERTAASKKAILEAAAQCFSKKGYMATSLGDIARECGVSTGLLTYHFGTKEGLLLELQAGIYREAFSQFQQVAAESGPSLARALGALDQVWRLLGAGRSRIPMVVDMLGRALTIERVREQLVGAVEENRALLRKGTLMAVGKPEGELGFSLDSLVEIVMATITGLWFYSALSEPPERMDQAFRDFRKVLEAFLEKKLS